VNADLTLNNCIVSNNTSTSSGGGMQNFSTSTVTINNSLFINNTSGGSTGGGGAALNGGARITNSTFANNTAPGGSGGGLQSNGSLGTVLTNVTFSGNTSTTNGGGIHRATTNVNFFIRNSIVAGNNGAAASPDVTNSAAGLDSLGNNIIGNTGTSTGWEASDLLNTAPMLNALADNGGFSMTFLPMAGSPALNAGQNCVVDLSCAANNPPLAVTTDQRGVSRPQGPAVDIGAVEVGVVASIVSISGTVVSSGGTPVPKAIVTLSNGNGIVATALTNGFGYFTLVNVTSVQTYSLSASSKLYSFTPQNINVSGNMTGVVITSGSGFSK
jgi:predicted outer membrane repeat protein